MPPTQLFFSFGFRTALERVAEKLGVCSGPAPVRAPGSKQPADEPQAWKHGIELCVVRHPRARRYLLRLQADGTARLVIPRRGSRREAFRFLERNEAWLLERFRRWQARIVQRAPWVHGAAFLFHGESVCLEVREEAIRAQLRFGDEVIETPCEADYRAVVLKRLRLLAEDALPRRTRELALAHGINIRRVTIRAQKTRWGSCSARGTISLNWRLIQAPPSVQDYLIIHELMHRRQMNHSPRFWALVAAACPAYREAEQWLKRTRLAELD